MRMRRLDLVRYGKFTDRIIDFGEELRGAPDFHIVFGPNEAGKSTALSAYLDILFGIEPRSRYGFMHGYNTMRIGASLELADGVVRQFVRVKRAQNSLLDSADQVVAEQAIAGHLGGIDREKYKAMFSLDDDTIEAGGKTILESKGELGQLLFSSSAGLANLSETLIRLRVEADRFYRPRAQGTQLSNLKENIKNLKERREALDTTASVYGRLAGERHRAREGYEETIKKRGAIQARMDEIGRLVWALPRLRSLQTLRDEAAKLPRLPAVPPGCREQLSSLQQEQTTLVALRQNLGAEIAKRRMAVSTITIEDKALALEGRVEGWTQLRARALTAEKDIPDRHLETLREDRAIAGLLGKIGQEDVDDAHILILPAAVSGALRDLIDQRSGIERSLASAVEETDDARDRLRIAADAVAAKQGGGSVDEGAQGTIGAGVAALQASDHRARQRLAEHAIAELSEDAAEKLTTLRPWTGDLDELAALRVPPRGDVQFWRERLAGAQGKQDVCREELDRLAKERQRIEAEYAAVSAVAGVVTEQESVAIRRERDGAWVAHRGALDADSADVFEQALRRDDVAMDGLLKHSAEAANLTQLARSAAQLSTTKEFATENFEASTGEFTLAQQAVAAEISAITPLLPPDMTIAQLETWLSARDLALETRKKLKSARRDLDGAIRDAGTFQQTLFDALTTFGISCDSTMAEAALLATAQSLLGRTQEGRALRQAMVDREQDVAKRERTLGKAVAADAAWSAAWSTACGACWLRCLGSSPALSTVKAALPVLSDLEAALSRRANLALRINQMNADLAALAAEAMAVAEELGLPFGNITSLVLAGEIAARVQTAVAARNTLADKQQQLDDAVGDERDLAERENILSTGSADMMAIFGVSSLIEVDKALREAEQLAHLERQIGEAERDIIDRLRVLSIAQAEALLGQADGVALDAELGALEAKFKDADDRKQELFAAQSRAEDQIAAVGGDAAVARIEEQRRTVLLEIEDGARQYLALRAGILAAEHALRRYREEHRSSMMQSASEAFCTMSRGAYTGLASQADKDTETLVAIAQDRSSKIASDLSKGTRFQLYLALRLAGYREFARQRDPVPFIADDIMETFDDFRAEEALKLFADMSQVGQVIYLTHHRHLCDIAQKICPEVRMHDLAAGA